MALVIDNINIFNNTFVSAYSVKILNFYTTTNKTPVFAFCNELKIYPDPAGKFHVDLSPLFRYYIQTNLGHDDKKDPFKDYNEIQLSTPIESKMFSNHVEQLKLIIHFTDDTHEDYVISNGFYLGTWRSLKENDFDYSYYKSHYGKIPEWSPVNNKITLFKGFPYDLTITNTNLYFSGFHNVQESRRIYVSDGEGDLPNGDMVFFNFQAHYVVRVKRKDCDGIQLKWLGQNTWKYWVFSDKHKDVVNAKDRGGIINDFVNDKNNTARRISLGKTATKTITLYANGLEAYEREYISDLIKSPKVYLYTGTKGQKGKLSDYIECEILTNTFTLNNAGKNEYKISFQIRLIEKTIY